MKLKTYLLSAAIFSASGCGSNPSNVGIEDDDARDNFYSEEDGNGATTIWNDVVEYLGLDSNTAGLDKNGEFDASADVEQQLTVWLTTSPEAFTVQDHANFNEVRTNAATKLVSTAISSQCGEIVGISAANQGSKTNDENESINSNSKFYYLRYKLRDAAGAVEESVRTGIISVPDSTAVNYPLIMYGHGNTIGLQYGEISTLFGSLQESAIIAAPSFPGEPMCAPNPDGYTSTCTGDKVVADAIHTQSGADIWNGDVNEFLGLYNCVNTLRASTSVAVLDQSKKFSDTGNTTSTATLLAKVAAISAAGNAGVPYTLLIGADRGGLVAKLAAARAGYYFYDLAQGDNSNITAYAESISFSDTPATVFPIGIGTLGTNVSLVLGTNRLALQYMYGGIISSTNFVALPGYALLGDLFAQYSINEELTIADSVAELAIRDMAFMGQFLAYSLRNWGAANEATGTDAKGQIINLHGTEDIIASYSQAQIADGIYTSINAVIAASNNSATDDSKKVPGFDYATYAFQASDTYFHDCAEDGKIDACESDTDHVFTGDGDKDGVLEDYNHVSDISFLTGKIVSYTTTQLPILGKATANTSVDNVGTCVLNNTGSTAFRDAARAVAIPLFAKASDEKAYSGDYSDSPQALTPSNIAGGWILNHFAQINGSGANGCNTIN